MKSQFFAGSAAAVLLSVCSSAVLAEALHLDDQVITANRTTQSPVPLTAAVSVVTREEIENKQIQSLPQLLKQLPGVSVSSNGGRGTDTSVSVRGTNADQLLVLVDGVRIGSATSGSAALQLIPVDLIERVELVRGPRSSLYGSDAIGGVLQIFTRRGTEEGVKPFASFAMGNRSTMNSTGGVSAKFAQGWYNLALESEHTDSFSARSYKSSSYEPDNDGYWALSGSLSGGYQFDNGLALQANYLRTKARSEFDGGKPHRDYIQEVYGLQGQFSPQENWLVTLKAGHSEDLSDNIYKEKPKNDSQVNTRRDTLGWQNEISITESQLLTLGADYQHDRIGGALSGAKRYDEDSRESSAVYSQYEVLLGRYGLQASVRHDHNQQFGDQATGGVGISYELSEIWMTSFTYGTGFRAPDFNDLYWPDYGNPDLKPEHSESYELGLTGDTSVGLIDVRVYETQIKDLIDSYKDPQTKKSSVENIEKARIRGLELSWKHSWQEWAFNANASFMRPENRSKDNHGKQLRRKPKRTFNFDIDRSFGDFSVGASSYLSSHRFDNKANSSNSRMGGYGLFDVRAEYRVTPEWRLQALLENVFDRRYQTAQTYEQPGRTLLFTVRYNAL